MLKHVRCMWLVPGQETLVPVEACRACAGTGSNPCEYPEPLIQMMTKDRDPNVVRCSATMFGGCYREHGLKANEEWSIRPQDAYTRAFGSLVHLKLEQEHSAGEHHTTEERWSRTLLLEDGREAVVTAGLDVLYYEDAEHTKARIRDYKVVDSISDSAMERKLPHYVSQFSIQRWILAGHGIEVTSVDLSFMTHKGRRPVNLFPSGEPELPSAFLMSLETTERYLRKRLPTLLDALEGRLPEPLSDPKQTWRCARCDVRDLCQARYGRPLPADL